ncbi:uncharacterized protein PHALS_11594 [Plasmopara halstedii]|uniref:Uncharacterized protein n=1 Tax=Plasmopara halstedii TaxID=4781 RepID=A0A0P1AJ58_PLAHL|nr:uncharacterized protein PHALS_11594 [Plasmopara halstedii]CEG41233.1 hypothetical protein PHALS_11594 [Plasmopara halstedii]|eukprot:XP_024577602.1 hypothetical protein PHALS_11594 [Plasmopara halstedii]
MDLIPSSSRFGVLAWLSERSGNFGGDAKCAGLSTKRFTDRPTKFTEYID